MRALVLSLLLLTGCSTVVPVTQKWPEAPGLQSMQACPRLEKLPDTTTLSGVAKTVSANYDQYYTCLIKLEAWQEWYQKQKLIHEGLK
jgi:hypothetical protein